MRKARAKFPTGTVMNKTEERYAREILEPRLLARELLWYRYEPMKLTIGYRMTYTPDFIAVRSEDGAIECHEVKAIWSTGKAGFIEDARVKVKAAAQAFPFFIFKIAAWQSPSRKHSRAGLWKFEEVKTRDDQLPK